MKSGMLASILSRMFLSSHLLSKSVNINIFGTIILCVVLCVRALAHEYMHARAYACGWHVRVSR